MDYNVNFKKEGDRFIRLFKEFEGILDAECEKAKISITGLKTEDKIKALVSKNSIIRNNKKILDLMRRARNVDSHELDGRYEYVVCTSPEINDKFESIINELKNPPFILDSKACIKRQNIYSRNLNDNIYETIKEMTNKLYTHVPIFDDGKFVGVFSESTLLDMVNLEGVILIEEDMTFKNIKEALKVEKHSMEDFIFIPRTKNIYEVEDIFKNYFSNQKRIGCIYITANGRPGESILGMTTAWDVLGN